jgi:hypothetical protein
MTPDEWAQVFEAGWKAILSKSEPAANALAQALRAMQLEALAIQDRRERSHS